ncbi:MAG: hydrogenase maturation protease [Gemmataceae bacterium]
MCWLVIGIGNTLRRDDGLGPWIAERIGLMAIPGVSIRSVHQLTPELAAEIGEHDRVLFVDACEAGDENSILEIFPSAAPNRLGHVLSPEHLLAISERLGVRRPRAWMATAAGSDFDFGEGLSASARQHSEALIPKIRSWLSEPSECTKSA